MSEVMNLLVHTYILFSLLRQDSFQYGLFNFARQLLLEKNVAVRVLGGFLVLCACLQSCSPEEGNSS